MLATMHLCAQTFAEAIETKLPLPGKSLQCLVHSSTHIRSVFCLKHFIDLGTTGPSSVITLVNF